MIKKTVIKNGKKYIVNAPGWEDGIGPGAPDGTLWMRSTDLNWYAVTLTGTSGSAAISINQTPLTWQSPGGDAGFELVYNNTTNKPHQVLLTGNAGAVAISVNQTPWSNLLDYKPFLGLKSTDGNFYYVFVSGTPVSVLSVNQNSKWSPIQSNPVPWSIYY